MSNGKGSLPRPVSVDPFEYERRWQATFGVITPSPKPNTNGDYVAIIAPPNPPNESP